MKPTILPIPHAKSPLRWGMLALLLFALSLFSASSSAPSAHAAPDTAPMASGWTLVKFPQGQPACTGVGWQGYVYYDRLDCGFGYVGVTETTPNSSVMVQFLDDAGNVLDEQVTAYRAEDVAWEFDIIPGNELPTSGPSWPSGEITIRVSNVDGQSGNFGETKIFLNQLGGTVAALGSGYQPGDAVDVTGTVYEIDQIPPATGNLATEVPATFSLQVATPSGEVRGPYGPYTAASDGTFNVTLPGDATAGVTAGPDTNYRVALAIQIVDAHYDDPLTGEWSAERAGAGSVSLTVPPDSLLIENSFVSSVGWVKPGDTYPFRVFVRNFTDSDATNVVVTIPNVDGTTFTRVAPANGSGSATIQTSGDETSIEWTVGTVAAATESGPSVATLVVEARADTLGQDPQIVWKDLSSTAHLSYDGGPTGLSSMSHGPKVIPENAAYETARYGDRPFPVVPVDYFDRKHEETHTGDALANKINSPDVPGSTFNLFQEMSLGQLFPHGTVPSAGLASAGWDVQWNSDRYESSGFAFSEPQPQGACAGTSFKAFADTPVYAERIVDGWYQLPGDTQYYGGDRFSAGSLAGAIAGIGPLFAIDDACGPTGKAVYDAAHIADPEIDYNQFDTDKDGVVDFFMMVFVGTGGNGASQTSVPPYDNIWPHSSSLEFYFTDPETGLTGYITDDPLTDLEGTPQCWTSTAYTAFEDCAANGGSGNDALPVYVRVGPYNVNPEDAIDQASVISHEYGHSLGLPDFYSLGNRETYGDWSLMATDKSQHMDVFAKQEMGWVVPNPLPLPGDSEQSRTTVINDWRDSKLDTGEIHWVQPDGTPYTLSAANGHQNIHNAETYVVKLPSRLIIDPAKVANGASLDHVWWSGSGNDFGCPPLGGHNLDIFLPELANVPAGAEITVEFSSLWDIEWDYDYGFVLVSTDGGNSYQSVPSENGYTTPMGQNPNANGCQAQYGNGLTGTSESYQAGTADVDRVLGNYPEPDGFLRDTYNISFAAGSSTILRFSYATDPGLAHPGWFIDDLTVSVDGQVLYETDFESRDDARLFPGGCTAHGRVAEACTEGWKYVSASAGSPADHAYYLEMRDRSGFDFDGKGENSRAAIGFQPGLLLVITDEAHGYGNVGVDNPPAQSPVDSRPEPGNDAPNLDDAAFKQGDSYSDFGPTGWVDNYSDPNDPLGEDRWRHLFDCLAFDVESMTGADVGPATVPGNLTGDVRLTLGTGCAAFDYGLPDPADNEAPIAVADARPTTAAVGETVTFDGSASYDDLTPSGDLTYEWDFDGDSTVDATGRTTTHAYATPGSYVARLSVTDAAGLSSQDTVTITVTDNESPNAVNDSATTQKNNSVIIDVLANDSDPDGDALSIVATSNPAHGSAEITTDNKVQYTPDPDYVGADTFTYTISDGERESSATVQVTVEEEGSPPTGGDVTGSGWLASNEGGKINFGFKAEAGDNGPEGHLSLRDKTAGVKVAIDSLTDIGEVAEACGSIAAGAANAVEFQGSGTFNGAPASFRVCAQDNGRGNNSAPDRFYLACTAGCTYNSGDRTPDDEIDAGNIKLHEAAPGGGGNGGGSGGGTSNASVLILDPLLLSEAPIGSVHLLEVAAYGADGALLQGVEITLTTVTAGGTQGTLTAVTDALGLATFPVTILAGDVEYVAHDADLSSNTIQVTGSAPLP